MKFSMGKIIWKIFSKILSIAFWVFFIFVLLIFFYIVREAKLDFEQAMNFFLILCSIYLAICLVYNLINLTGFLAALLSGLVLFFYFSYGYQLLSHIQTGIIDNNFFWSLPDSINNLIGFSIKGRVIDFLFWSSFALSALITASQLELAVLLFLAKMKIGFALEIVEEKKAKLMEIKRAQLEIQSKSKMSPKKTILAIVIGSILLVVLVVSLMSLSEKWENKKYPILWEKSFPGTAIWLEDCQQCGKKGTVLQDNINPGEPRIASFSLAEKDKKMILDVKLTAQPRIKPEFSLELELKNPDKKTIFYIGKEELFKGSLTNPELPVSRRFYFTSDEEGEYTLKITPHSYGIFSIKVLVRDIIKNR